MGQPRVCRRVRLDAWPLLLAINRILAQHGIWWSLAIFSLGGCWVLAQHGIWWSLAIFFAWRVLDSGSAWLGWSPAMLRLEGAGTALRSLEGRSDVVTSQLPFSSPAEALLG